jgi:hypothetical protein
MHGGDDVALFLSALVGSKAQRDFYSAIWKEDYTPLNPSLPARVGAPLG